MNSLIKTSPCEAPFSSDAKRKEFCCSRLFKVTGRLIGILMICGCGDGKGMINIILAVVFQETGLGSAMPLPRLWEEFEKLLA